ncbi:MULTISPECIES: SIS domain-containing protein [unclassified Lentimonas]|uniref:KpsF/GutQ family sugar-phosphate isomerase n=1 Tax=unclassified Lentimonas TaxID=2630993 RepID=UPI0013256D62|nr:MULTISPECIES: KpsF/GutQ family sugar-phosphate isomerase [unclassified Lentimonas]CAA6679516.1 Arabinose 5-phosphate isomerase (EC [Lentimonas sp. CC4]CAA6687187.1 Arabinose 5-phosphate isomerase (EC [Lentimonas sp. CC6]CAA7075466.1 Arabinose 5-phosphate isomerase (EC [Lentimonas sp. CC4]CAA7170232.1 Arabinose 5-phosphate isomerase (EC [Lentimonas sp. CC21]CAA7182527.1 Arabinose 5-phosphate isomerase (EC [Lentimonas sp. CC8]
MSNSGLNRLEVGRQSMQAEAAAIQIAADRLGASFERALDVILESNSKLVICGIGKSGHIGTKLAATLSSCGIPSVFLHAAEAIHGDLGVYQPGDPTIVLSKSGSTSEVLRLMPMFKKFKSPVIAIVGNMDSPIAKGADVVLDGSVEREADPLNLMPTSSSTVSLAIGDALAAALVQARDFTKEEFATFHPGGQLGRNLLMTVGDVMHAAEQVACAQAEETLREVVIRMTKYPLGGACVVDGDGCLTGIITDGDIRRILSQEGDILSMRVGDCMTKSPIFTQLSMSLGDAVRIMEDRSSQISVLPVVANEGGKLIGLLRLHDAYQPSFS